MTGPSLADFVADADLAALDRPAGEALGLPAHCYGEDFYALEQRTLFPRRWCPVAFACDVPEPGDALAVDFAGWPLAVVHGGDGQIRVFHNVCRHRATRVVEGSCKGLSRLICPWHAWTYGLDGRLVGTPRIGGERAGEDPAFDKSDVDLKEVRSALWLGLVMANIDGRAPPFADHIRPLEALFTGYDLGDLRVGNAWGIDFPGNWKLAVENAIEDYHLPYIHRELVSGVRDSNYRLDHADGCYYSNSTCRDSVGGYRGVERAGNGGPGEELPSLLGGDAAVEPRTFAVNLFPNGFVTLRPNCVWLWLMMPDGARRTRVDTRQYYKGSAATDPALAGARERLEELWRFVLGQDAGAIAAVQENYDRPGEAGIRTRFSPYWESNIQRFQQAIVAALIEG